MSFEHYLSDRGFSSSSIKEYTRRANRFKEWLELSGLDELSVYYRHIMEYIKELKAGSVQVATVINDISAVKAYFDYLVLKGVRVDSPSEGVTIRGGKKRVLHNLLSEDELEDLYHSFEIKKTLRKDHELSARRNRVMVGLMVFQGLNTTDMKAMEVVHARPDEGIIEVPGSRKMKRRKLDLRAFQVLPLDRYLNEEREVIASQRGIRTEKLFIPNERLKDITASILKQLRLINANLQNSNQIRASVIANWLKQHNIRKVQYMAGHRFISSTEKYKQDNLERLQEAVNLFHPFQ